jgi:hypothetical protein
MCIDLVLYIRYSDAVVFAVPAVSFRVLRVADFNCGKSGSVEILKELQVRPVD